MGCPKIVGLIGIHQASQFIFRRVWATDKKSAIPQHAALRFNLEKQLD